MFFCHPLFQPRFTCLYRPFWWGVGNNNETISTTMRINIFFWVKKKKRNLVSFFSSSSAEAREVGGLFSSPVKSIGPPSSPFLPIQVDTWLVSPENMVFYFGFSQNSKKNSRRCHDDVIARLSRLSTRSSPAAAAPRSVNTPFTPLVLSLDAGITSAIIYYQRDDSFSGAMVRRTRLFIFIVYFIFLFVYINDWHSWHRRGPLTTASSGQLLYYYYLPWRKKNTPPLCVPTWSHCERR